MHVVFYALCAAIVHLYTGHVLGVVQIISNEYDDINLHHVRHQPEYTCLVTPLLDWETVPCCIDVARVGLC